MHRPQGLSNQNLNNRSLLNPPETVISTRSRSRFCVRHSGETCFSTSYHRAFGTHTCFSPNCPSIPRGSQL